MFLSILTLFGIFLFVLLAILFLILEFSVTIVSHLFGAPFIRSNKKKIKTMLELADLKLGEKAIDLGSGDGEIVIEASKKGARAVGIEINPFLVWYSRLRVRHLGLGKEIKILRADFRTFPLNNFDVIFIYLWPGTIEKLKEKLNNELRPGARIVSNAFPIPGWNYILEKGGVYLYRKEPPSNFAGLG